MDPLEIGGIGLVHTQRRPYDTSNKALRDEIVDNIGGNRVVLSKTEAGAAGDPFAVFGEWSSEADRRAYAGL